MLYSTVSEPQLCADELNHDLNEITKWAHQWKMSFNPDIKKQAVELCFSNKRTKSNHPPLYFNGSIVKRVSHHKHLGMILDSSLISLKRVLVLSNFFPSTVPK